MGGGRKRATFLEGCTCTSRVLCSCSLRLAVCVLQVWCAPCPMHKEAKKKGSREGGGDLVPLCLLVALLETPPPTHPPDMQKRMACGVPGSARRPSLSFAPKIKAPHPKNQKRKEHCMWPPPPETSETSSRKGPPPQNVSPTTQWTHPPTNGFFSRRGQTAGEAIEILGAHLGCVSSFSSPSGRPTTPPRASSTALSAPYEGTGWGPCWFGEIVSPPLSLSLLRHPSRAGFEGGGGGGGGKGDRARGGAHVPRPPWPPSLSFPLPPRGDAFFGGPPMDALGSRHT